MEKGKELYFTLIVLFCAVLMGIGGFYLGTEFTDDKTVENTGKVENKLNSSDLLKEENNLDVLKQKEVSSYIKGGLYSYIKSNKSDLINYFTSMNNSNKLYMAGILNEQNYSTLENNLMAVFGNNLGLEKKDYYILETDEEPLYKYDSTTSKYVYNENVLGSDLLSELDQKKVYNYKLKDVKKDGENYIASYYGLYEYAGSVGPSTLSNEENIEIVVEDEKASQSELDAKFNENEKDFFVFEYIYTLKDDSFYLTGFKQA